MTPRPSIDAPDVPLRGVRLFTLRARHYGPDSDPCSNLWSLGDCYRIARVNGRSFYWRAAKAQAGRRLVVEWRQWLSELQRIWHVWLLEPEPSTSGWMLIRPLQPVAAQITVTDALDRFERDQRFRRAVQQVAKHYTLRRSESADGAVVVAV